MSKENEVLKLVRKTFDDYFSSYYMQNKAVQGVTPYNMERGAGCSVIIQYDGFRQYVNFYKHIPLTDNMAVINTCFEFTYTGVPFYCYFDTVLDYLDSDDISFYNFPHCATEEAIREKLDLIMSATQKSFDSLLDIVNNEVKKSDLKTNFNSFSKFEKATDLDYLEHYKDFYSVNEFYLNLKLKAGKDDTLIDPFEKRAYRVLGSMTISQRRGLEKAYRKKANYATLDKVYMYVPQLLILVLSIGLSVFLGIYLDKNVINPQWIGKSYGYTGLAFGIVGVTIGLALLMLNIDKPIYKLIVPKEHYEDFMIMLKAEESPKLYSALVMVLAIIASCIFVIFFAFTGMAVTDDYNIVSRAHCFSQVQEYDMKDIEIAIVKGTNDTNGYNEYIEDAYAFKLDGEWVEFGVPNAKAQQVIQEGIEKYNKQINTYKSIEDIN